MGVAGNDRQATEAMTYQTIAPQQRGLAPANVPLDLERLFRWAVVEAHVNTMYALEIAPPSRKPITITGTEGTLAAIS